MTNVKRMIDHALEFGEAYSNDQATSEHFLPRAQDTDSEIFKLASALSFIADNLEDNEPSAEEKLAEAELLMSYLQDQSALDEEENYDTANYDFTQQVSSDTTRRRLANILSR
jgi:hypothetical protein